MPAFSAACASAAAPMARDAPCTDCAPTTVAVVMSTIKWAPWSMFSMVKSGVWFGEYPEDASLFLRLSRGLQSVEA